MLYIVTPELCGIGFLFLDVSEGVKANQMFIRTVAYALKQFRPHLPFSAHAPARNPRFTNNRGSSITSNSRFPRYREHELQRQQHNSALTLVLFSLHLPLTTHHQPQKKQIQLSHR
jgi:hypothetical protein